MWKSAYIGVYQLLNWKMRGETLKFTKCVFSFSLKISSEIFIILRRTERDMGKNVYRSACKVPVIVDRLWWKLYTLDSSTKNTQTSTCNGNCTLWTVLRKILRHQLPWKFIPWQLSWSVRTGGRVETDFTKLIFIFRNFSSGPKHWDIRKFYVNTQSVPRSKHNASRLYKNQSVNVV